jgi:hypothetical protein
MTNNLTVKDLERIGFEKIGKWKALESLKNPDKKAYECRKPIDHEWEDENHIIFLRKKILYAFVYGEEIKYIGKTTKGAKERLKWYIDPSIEGHSTNKNVNDEIYKIVQPSGSDKNIDIWLFAPDPDTLKYKGFDLDLAAGLEEGLIAKIGTECWNKIFKSK